MSKTPLTDHYTKRLRNLCDDEFVPIEFARKLERELSAVTEQRDRLAEVIKAATVLIAAKGRHNTMLAYEGLKEALAAVKGGQP
jgi:hypothetical protein